MPGTLCPVLLFVALSAAQPSQAQQPGAAPPQAAPSPAAAGAAHEDIAPADRLEAKDLAAAIQKSASPLILHVGPRPPFEQAHILDAEHAGPANTEAGRQELHDHVATTAKDRWIVLYCGCGPDDRSAYLRPALQQLRTLGYTHVQVLSLPTSFKADWVDKGFPIEK